jgi:hypothetical protein
VTETLGLYGVVAEFDGPGPLVDAARAARARGYRNVEAYTPYPVAALEGVLEETRSLPLIVLIGGILGFLTAWSMEFYIAVIDYPTNIGGRPLNSWPSFIVIMFELTVLFASLFAFFGMLTLCGFPRPHHPIFNVTRFGEASNDHFFLCIEARDPLFEAGAASGLLGEFDPLEIWKVDDD